jgi:ribonuclease-3
LRSYDTDIPSLQEKIGYRFNDPELLIEALTHKSFHHENPKKAPHHNERLEFLGDSVLGLVIVSFLFSMDERCSESTMSKIKSYIVKRKVLSEIASSLSLGDYLRIGKGEDDTGGRKKSSILSNALEALIGAVYVDGGMKEARDLVQRMFGERLDAAISHGDLHDYKTELQEVSQMRSGVLPEYRLAEQKGSEHRRIFVYDVYVAGRCLGHGIGKSKKEAQEAAAKEALEALSK